MTTNKFKGVSPIIATILMVMVTVGLVAFSYTWFMSMGQSVQTSTGSQLTAMEKAQQGINIGTAYKCGTDVCFEVRASALNSLTIPTNGTSYYYNNEVESITAASITGCTECSTAPELAPGGKCCGKIAGITCKIGDKLRISIPWGAETTASINGCSS